jgi:hypothetical protein
LQAAPVRRIDECRHDGIDCHAGYLVCRSLGRKRAGLALALAPSPGFAPRIHPIIGCDEV